MNDLTKRFMPHVPRNSQIKKFEEIRGEARLLATTIYDLCPDGEERAASITRLEEVVFWAHASIARS